MYGPHTERGRQLGNLTDDDAVNYSGKGLIQLTGRHNVDLCGRALGINLLADPDLLVRDLGVSARAFAWYWQTRNIQEQADRLDWVSVRRIVQGGTNGLYRVRGIAVELLAA